MLEPGHRVLYLDEMRPPDGYRLDRAIGTTYSLDLMSMLLVPFSMAMFEGKGREELIKEPLGLIEAVRRMAGRFAVFHQCDKTSVPRQQQLLYGYLEDAAIPVSPKKGNGVFHPKVWVLRFVADEGDVIYRVLCMSRNLTFDKSWDTALVLEGVLNSKRSKGYVRNKALSEFVLGLPGLATEKVSPGVMEHVEMIAEEVNKVQFEVPWPFCDDGYSTDLVFNPMGMGLAKSPDFEACQRLLIISPFLTEGFVKDMIDLECDLTVVSRVDSLNSLTKSTYDELEESGAGLFSLQEAAESSQEFAETSASSEDNEVEVVSDLHGLHAKLFVAEYGAKDVRWLTGSANATDAAFKGSNVEFMVRLVGLRRDVGIDKIMGDISEDDLESNGIAGLLQPYVRPEDWEQAKDPAKERAEELLRILRRQLVAAGLWLDCTALETDLFEVALNVPTGTELPKEAHVRVAPLTLDERHSKVLDSSAAGERIVLGSLPAANLTRFLAVYLQAGSGESSTSEEFVLKVEQTGFPEDRDARVLHSIISDAEQFLRYLMFLLTDMDINDIARDLVKDSPGKKKNGAAARGHLEMMGVPVFEELLRAYSRDPARLGMISGFIRDVKKYSRGVDVMPEGFLRMWEAFEPLIPKKDDEVEA